MNELQYCLDLMPNTVQGFDFHFNQTPHNKSQHSIHFGIEKQPFSMPHLTQSLSHLHRWLKDAQIILSHDAIDISFFSFCLFTSSSVGLSCLLFPLNFRQPPPTYFIANKILYQSKRVACIKNRHEWKKNTTTLPTQIY